jgi:hypothetical protein
MGLDREEIPADGTGCNRAIGLPPVDKKVAKVTSQVTGWQACLDLA